jgi:pimeloyl-ACP methyl ester carboxylesterase
MRRPANETNLQPFFGRSSWGLALLCAATTAMLVACGGDAGRASDSGQSANVPPDDPIVTTVGPGEFRGVFPLASLTKESIQSAWVEPVGTPPGAMPAYGVVCWRLEYFTVDSFGRQVLASALAVVPQKSPGTASPVLAYQHGTMTRDAQAPSNQCQTAEPSVMLASLGYIVLAADYVGYGSSKGAPHPYLLAEPSAAAVVDLLTAAKLWRQTRAVKDNRQLFLMGYSEGAYVSVAAGRKLASGTSTQSRDLKAIFAGAGPYRVDVTLGDLLDQVRAANPVLGALINPGFLKFLSEGARTSVRNALLKELLGPDADVEFMPTAIDNYLADDGAAIAQASSVHDWTPVVPLKLFHGVDDRVVSYRTATTTVAAMQGRGAGALVDLTRCNAPVADHLACAPLFLNFSIQELRRLAKDL